MIWNSCLGGTLSKEAGDQSLAYRSAACPAPPSGGHGKREVFDSDQRSQFTNDDFTGVLKREARQRRPAAKSPVQITQPYRLS